jgi:hypothetical protein
LDAAVAEEVMGAAVKWTLSGTPYNATTLGHRNPDEELIQDWRDHVIRWYSSNPWDCRDLEVAIEKRGLQSAYVNALSDLVTPIADITALEWFEEGLWKLVTASAEQRARAALRAVRGARTQPDPDPEPRWMCKVCYATPDAEGWVRHGKGCYQLSEDGGGEEYVGDEL